MRRFIGWVARDLKEGGSDTIDCLLVALLTFLVLAVMQWGIVALAITALTAVPVIIVNPIQITMGTLLRAWSGLRRGNRQKRTDG